MMIFPMFYNMIFPPDIWNIIKQFCFGIPFIDFYPNGNIHRIGFKSSNNTLYGIYKSYYQNNSLKKQCYYFDDKLYGEWHYFNKTCHYRRYYYNNFIDAADIFHYKLQNGKHLIKRAEYWKSCGYFSCCNDKVDSQSFINYILNFKTS